jgi:hypothetical protein
MDDPSHPGGVLRGAEPLQPAPGLAGQPAPRERYRDRVLEPEPVPPARPLPGAGRTRHYFQFTVLGYPREIDPKSPPAEAAVRVFQALSERLGPERVIWRYDPVLFSGLTTPEFHEENFGRLAQRLRGCTRRVVVSVLDIYRKAEHRLNLLRGGPAEIVPADEPTLRATMRTLADIARANGLEIVSCAEEIDLQPCGIRPGRCVDDGLIHAGCGHAVPSKKDPSQRKACGCVASRDIGMYDSCLYLCPYCYATQSFNRAREQYKQHDPDSPSLVGWHDAPAETSTQQTLFGTSE